MKIIQLSMHKIAPFKVPKCKKSLPWEVGHPPPTPSRPRSLRSLGLGRFAPSKKNAPEIFWLITPLNNGGSLWSRLQYISLLSDVFIKTIECIKKMNK